MHDGEIRNPGGGKLTNAERIARAWIKQAASGNMQAIEKATDRIDGKVVDKQALTDSAGNDRQLTRAELGVLLSDMLSKPST